MQLGTQFTEYVQTSVKNNIHVFLSHEHTRIFDRGFLAQQLLFNQVVDV